MKANELILFDRVRRVKDKKPMIVTGLEYSETISAITSDDMYYGDQEDYHESQVEPIPLTVEILEKNGFEKRDVRVMLGTKLHFVISDDYFDVALNEYTDSIWEFEYYSTEAHFPPTHLLIAHVHELQHALKLCGIDKEITV